MLWRFVRDCALSFLVSSRFLKVFGNIPDTVEPPDWLNDTEMTVRHPESEKPGRTYFATRTLPHGQGAFAYIGVSLSGCNCNYFAFAGINC